MYNIKYIKGALMFVARESELNTLNSLLSKDKSSLVVVYGRRRIGKTEMVREFINKNNLTNITTTGVYKASKQTQIRAFVKKINKLISNNEKKQVNHWDEAFSLVGNYIETIPAKEKKVIFLDEFPWLDSHKSDFLEAFSYFWNDFCTARKDIIVIVCGSAASYMVNKIINNKKTLHNRVTVKLYMQQFNLKDTKELLKANLCNWSDKSIVEMYMTFGGVAKYIEDVNSNEHPRNYIQKQCFEKNSLMKNEYDDLYESLFDNGKWHHLIMNELSTKWIGFTQKDLANKLNVETPLILKALDELEMSGFITILQKFGQVKRDRVYRATDCFSYFHNKWIKNQNTLNTNWQKIANTQSFISWSGYAFENICHMHIDQIKYALGISGINISANYWNYIGKGDDKGAQIDMLLEYTDGSKCIDIVECKFYNEKYQMSKKDYLEIRGKISVFQKQTNYKYNVRLVLITSFGIKENEYSTELVNKNLTILDLIN